MISEMFEKLVNNRLVDHFEKCGLFSDFQSMVSGLLNQLQIFWQFYLIELIGLLIGTTQAVELDIQGFWKGVGACWSSSQTQLKISGRVFSLISFSVIDSFRWFWMREISARVSSQCWSFPRLLSRFCTFPTIH